MSTPVQPGWYDDPFRRHEHRYWDGVQWTDHVGSRGQRSNDPPTPSIGPPVENSSAGAWLPDPFGRHETRYWDGRQWTHHVGSHGRQLVDLPGARWGSAPAGPAWPVVGAPPATPRSTPSPNRKIQKQARRAGATGESGGGTLFTERVLVVNQRAKVFGSTLQYAVFDQDGRQLGAIQEVARGLGQRFIDQQRGHDQATRTRRFHVVDANDQVVLGMTRPESWFGLKPRMIVQGSGGRPIGEITRETLGVAGALGFKDGHTRFGLEAAGHRLGSIHAEATNAWDFSIRDASGVEVGRVTKSWAGYAKERFTKADNYVVEMDESLEDPLRSLVVAAALALDVALKEGTASRGRRGLMTGRRYK